MEESRGDSYYVEQTEDVEWAAIEPMVEPYMSVWNDSSELRWGEYAWQVLGNAGLTSYQTEVERTMCLLRALALAALSGAACPLPWAWIPATSVRLTINYLLGPCGRRSVPAG